MIYACVNFYMVVHGSVCMLCMSTIVIVIINFMYNPQVSLWNASTSQVFPLGTLSATLLQISPPTRTAPSPLVFQKSIRMVFHVCRQQNCGVSRGGCKEVARVSSPVKYFSLSFGCALSPSALFVILIIHCSVLHAALFKSYVARQFIAAATA